MNAIGSLWWFLPSLRELPDSPAQCTAWMARSTSEPCLEWAGALELLRQRVNQDVVARWLDPIEATRDGDTLVLLAPDRFHRDFVNDNYAALINEALTASNPANVSLRIEIRESAREARADA